MTASSGASSSTKIAETWRKQAMSASALWTGFRTSTTASAVITAAAANSKKNPCSIDVRPPHSSARLSLDRRT